jgi:hypothetical protein
MTDPEVERRPGKTREEAFMAAYWLLDQAERRAWNRGEAISVEVWQADE